MFNWFIDWLSNIFLPAFQEYGGLLEIVITLTSTAISIFLWLRHRIREKHVSGIAIPNNISKGHDHAALVVDLTSSDPTLMVEQIKNSIPQQRKMRALTDNLINAAPLRKEAFDAIGGDSGFQCTCHERFVTIANSHWMPNDSEGAKKYITAFNLVLNTTFSILKKTGITTLHVFYHGPMPLCAYLGAKCTDQFNVFYYHYSQGAYYLLGSGGLIKPAETLAEKGKQ